MSCIYVYSRKKILHQLKKRNLKNKRSWTYHERDFVNDSDR
jgi:hypothetical protein